MEVEKADWIADVTAYSMKVIADGLDIVEKELGPGEQSFDYIPKALQHLYAFIKSMEEYRTNLTMSGIDQSLDLLPVYHSVGEWEQESTMETIEFMQKTEDFLWKHFWIRLRAELHIPDGEEIDIRRPNIVIKVPKKICLAVDNTRD